MKKIILLATTLCLLLVVLAGCDGENYPSEDGLSFRATILEMHDTHVLVQTIEGMGFHHVTRVVFGTRELEDIGASVGDVVNVLFTGDILYTYPEEIFATSWSIVERHGQTEHTICDICGVNHQAAFEDGVSGAPFRNDFFEVFSADPYSNEFLRIYVKSCWVGSIQSEFRLHFVARYDIAKLFDAISIAESNVPFEATFDNDIIRLTTDIVGLEEISITLNERQREVGYAFKIVRKFELEIPRGEADDIYMRVDEISLNDNLIIVTMFNHTDYEFITGLHFIIEFFDGLSWRQVPWRGGFSGVFVDVGYDIQPHDSTSFTKNLELVEPLNSGLHRIRKSVFRYIDIPIRDGDLHDVVAEFYLSEPS